MDIQLSESIEFARLSGDFNPLHCDGGYASETQFESTIVHGMHLVCRSLDQMADRTLFLNGLQASFEQPLRHGVPFSLDCDERVVTVSDQAQTLAVIQVELSHQATRAAVPLNHIPFEAAEASEPSWEEMTGFSHTEVATLGDRVRDCFPSLEVSACPLQLAQLLFITRVIGMMCPGKRALLTGLDLRFAEGEERSLETTMVVTRVNQSLRMLQFDVRGGGLRGVVRASVL